MTTKQLLTSESVTEGHPDKLADAISDSILDALLSQDPNSRVAVETMVTTGSVIISGEVTTTAIVDFGEIARNTIKEIGYTDPKFGMDYEDAGVWVSIHKQSPDISQGVTSSKNKDQGAGDQGMMYGFATNETPELMPMPIVYAHKLTKRLAEVRKKGLINYLGPDGKSQVTIEYEDNIPKRIDAIVIAQQHKEELSEAVLKMEILNKVIKPVCGKLIDKNTKIHINATGRFIIGGPEGDTGLTGRKIIVDTYGGIGRHGGGCFCVDKDTEYLTKEGWKNINSYKKGTMIAQWDNGKLEFVNPIKYVANPADKMFRFSSSSNVDMVLSQEHDMIYKTSKNKLNKKKVKDVIEQHNNSKTGFKGLIPVYFKYSNNLTGIKLTDDQIKLQVAFCADGTILKKEKKTYGRIRIKKENKIKRLTDLLKSTNITYTLTDDKEFKIFWFNPPIKDKSLYNCFKYTNSKQYNIIAKEVFLWDGDEKTRVFRTTNKEDADFIQFIFMSVFNKSSSILIDDRLGEEYGSNNQYKRKSISYSVYAKKNAYIGLKNKSGKEERTIIKEFKPKDKKMYCFNVPSGMLILRRNNRVFVTGNSGKDPSKVDRSGAYMARYVAKNIVAAKLADKCEVQISYAIGVAEPTSVYIDCFGTNKIPEEIISKGVMKVFDFRPQAIIKTLNLRRPIYKATSAYGHFGRSEKNFTWEHTDKASILKKLKGGHKN